MLLHAYGKPAPYTKPSFPNLTRKLGAPENTQGMQDQTMNFCPQEPSIPHNHIPSQILTYKTIIPNSISFRPSSPLCIAIKWPLSAPLYNPELSQVPKYWAPRGAIGQTTAGGWGGGGDGLLLPSRTPSPEFRHVASSQGSALSKSLP